MNGAINKAGLGLAVSVLLLLTACHSERNDGKYRFTSYRKNLFNPLYIDQLISPPFNFGTVWNQDNIRQLGIRRISVALKASGNADEDLEKHQYLFDSLGRSKEYNYFDYEQSVNVINQCGFAYSGMQLQRINIYRYLNMSNVPPLQVHATPSHTVFVTPRAAGKNDSLFFYPHPTQPRLIMEKVAQSVQRLEVLVEAGSGPMQILKQVSLIDTNLTRFEMSEKVITYMKKGLPQQSFNMDERWNTLELIRKWEYNDDNQPVGYKEWLHGTLVKDITVSYNEHALPKKIVFNRKKYVLIYRKSE